MSDFKQTDTGDLFVAANGDLVLVEGLEAIAQHCEIRLRTFKGEWFLDTRIGVPWFEEILKKAPQLGVVSGILKQVILGTPGILSLQTFDIDFDLPTRELLVTFEAATTDGPLSFTERLIVDV